MEEIKVNRDELQLAHNIIDNSIDCMARLLEALQELGLRVDEDLSDVFIICNSALEEAESGRMTIESLLKQAERKTE